MSGAGPATTSPHEDFHSLTAFQRDILIVTAGMGASPGVGIRETLDGYYNTEVEHSRFYQAIDRLANKGIVDKSSVDGRTNSYELSAHGELVLAAGKQFHREMAGDASE